MAIAGPTLIFYEGKSENVEFESLTDWAAAAIDWTTAISAAFKITTGEGEGTVLISKTLGDMTATATKLTVPIAAGDWGSASPSEDYYYELAVDFGAGTYDQIVAPSRCELKASKT